MNPSVYIFMLLYMACAFATYVIWVAKKFGVLYSISSSWYHLNKNQKWFFIAMTWSLGIPLLLIASYGGPQLYALAGGLMCSVGLAGHYKSAKVVNIIHNIGSVGSIITCCTILAISGWWWSLISILIGIIAFRLYKINNFVWWFEVLAFIVIFIGLMSL